MTISASKWLRGHVDPWWNDDFKQFDYTYSPLQNTWDEDRWRQQGYVQPTLNGANYDPNLDLDWVRPWLQLMPWQNQGLRFFRMNTMELFPLHRDHYSRYREVFGITDPGCVWRCVVFLEDWRSGHYFEIDGHPVVNWKAGDWIRWNNDVEHYAGNIGLEPRYTVQITGMTE